MTLNFFFGQYVGIIENVVVLSQPGANPTTSELTATTLALS
jgi:hypothetical protein